MDHSVHSVHVVHTVHRNASEGKRHMITDSLLRRLVCALLLSLALTTACAPRPSAVVRALPAPQPTHMATPLPPPPAIADTGRSSPEWQTFVEGRAALGDFEDFAPIRQPLAPGPLDHELLNAAVFYCTNAERVRNDRAPLAWCPALGRAAERYSADMARQGFFSHQHPNDPSRRTFVDRLRREGVPLEAAAENIAEWRPSESETYLDFAHRIVRSWMNSSVHRTNILGRNYAYLGVGVGEPGGAGGKIYATQELSSVRAAP